MAPRLPIPRITLKRRPSSRNDSPGLSSVPASIEPIITLSAPAASALTRSPEYLMPPSAITGTSPAPVLILVGVGMPPALEDVLDGDQALEDATLVHDRQLLDAVLGEDPLRIVETRAHRCGHQAILGHRVADRTIQLALELQVAVGDDAHEAPGVVYDRDARDAEPLHQAHRLPQRPVRSEGDGVQDHPRFAALHAVHLRRLAVHRHVLVDDADAALTRDRDRHLRFGDRIHGGGHERDVEGDAAGKARAHVHVPRMYAREPRNEQNVVESESGSRPEGSHGESYWAGGVSSTLSLSVDFFAASSTAAFPAAATFSSNFPAFPTASIVPVMMLTGTRPARSVSSSVSATRWNGGAPAGRSAYLDSRNST